MPDFISAVLADAPAWALRFTENDAPFEDISPNNRDGVVTLGDFAQAGLAAGPPRTGSGAITLTMDGGRIQAGDGGLGTVRPANNFTQEVWAKPIATITLPTETTSGVNAVNVGGHLLTTLQTLENRGAGIHLGTNGIIVAEHGNNNYYAVARYAGTLSQEWHHIVHTCTNKQHRIYLNGVLVRTGVTSTAPNVYSTSGVGTDYYQDRPNFTGQIGFVAVYPTALSDQQVLDHYKGSTRGYLQELLDDGPTLLWRLQEGSGTVATDESGAGRHGTISGGVTYGQAGPGAPGLPNAIYFSSGEAQRASEAALQITGALSLEWWQYRTQANGRQNPIHKSYFREFSTSIEGADQGTYASSMSFYHGNGNSSSGYTYWQSQVTGTTTTGVWEHHVMTRTAAGAMTHYKNGVWIDTEQQQYSPSVGTDPFRVGRGYLNANFEGRIAGVAIYPVALSQYRVAQHYASVTQSLGITATLPGGSSFIATPRAIYGGASFKGRVMSSIPYFYWRLNEQAGTTAAEVMGRLPATYTGGYTLNQVSDLYNKDPSVDRAVLLNGTTGYVATAATLWNPAVGSTGKLTIEAVIKTTANTPVNGTQSIVTKGGANNWQFSLARNADASGNQGLYFVIFNTAGNGHAQAYLLGGAAALTPGVWHHIAGTFDRATSTIILYKDGVEINRNQIPINPSYEPTSTNVAIEIGRRPDGYYFNGVIDEVAIYDRALTPAEVVDHAAAIVTPRLTVAGNGHLSAGLVRVLDGRTSTPLPQRGRFADPQEEVILLDPFTAQEGWVGDETGFAWDGRHAEYNYDADRFLFGAPNDPDNPFDTATAASSGRTATNYPHFPDTTTWPVVP